MLKLDLSNKERWIDLGHGVRVKVRPMTTALMLQAQNARAVDPTELASGDVDAVADQAVNFAAAVAKIAIVEWSGVGGDDGAPIAVSPSGIDALMQVFPIFNAFQRLYIAQGMMLAAEKNVSAPSPNGTTGGARPTAKGAKALAKTARHGRTGR